MAFAIMMFGGFGVSVPSLRVVAGFAYLGMAVAYGHMAFDKHPKDWSEVNKDG